MKVKKKNDDEICENFSCKKFRSNIKDYNKNFEEIQMLIVSIDHPNRDKVKLNNRYFIEFYSSLRHHLVHVNSGFNIDRNILKYLQYLFQDDTYISNSLDSIVFYKGIFNRSYQGLIDKAYPFYRLGCEFLEIENEIIQNKKSSYT